MLALLMFLSVMASLIVGSIFLSSSIVVSSRHSPASLSRARGCTWTALGSVFGLCTCCDVDFIVLLTLLFVLQATVNYSLP